MAEINEPMWVASADPDERAVTHLHQLLCRYDAPRFAISGGSAASIVGPLRRALGIHWTKLRLTWADERRVAFGHEDSNRGAAYRAEVLEEAVPPSLELPLYEDGETREQAETRVTQALQDDFGGGLDVVLLGMGGDGHVASLFVGADWRDEPVYGIDDSPKPPPERMTLSRPFLATASHTVLFAKGEAKRDALLRLREGDPSLPATGLPGLVVFSDQVV